MYRALLNSPKIAEGWLTLFTAIRQQADLPDQYRELAIMLIAVINGADYEYQGHVPFALKAGLTQSSSMIFRRGGSLTATTPGKGESWSTPNA
jgi:alkylhydroperoxidase family enzyme